MSRLTLILIKPADRDDLTAEAIAALYERLTGATATPEDRQDIRDELAKTKGGGGRDA